MPSIDRSGRAHATRQQVRVVYSQHKIEEQALNQGTAKRMNSNGASPGASTIFYSAGAASGTGEELAAVLLANSAPPPPPPPTAPTDVNVSYYPLNQDTVFTVSWLPPTGGSPPTLYTITASPGDIVLTSDPALGQFVVFGKSNGIIIGTTYTFVVTATSSAGTSPPSVPSPPIKAITYPDPPTAVTATAGEDKKSTVSWTPPTYDGDSPILFYTIYSLSAQDPVVHLVAVDGATSSSVVVTGLTNGFKYRFYVKAFNSFGEGQQSSYSPIIIPRGPPSPPLNVVATPGNASADVTWDVPVSNGGLPISSYTITSKPGNIIVVSVQIPTLIQNLISGTEYTFTVYATNLIGNSLSSIPSLPVTVL